MKPKHLAKLLAAVTAAITAIAMAAPLAQADTPAKGYEAFDGCPSQAENKVISSCVVTTVTGGHFQMGSKDVPITKPIVLKGGFDENSKNFAYNSKGGLLPAKQLVPGGVIGLTGLDWLVNFLGVEALQLFAVTELAGTPDFSGEESIFLPIKVHLINPVLGSNCYVGSASNPITLHLTQGTTSPPPPNKPISGNTPKKIEFDPVLEILHAKEATAVDNSFAAPGASGCVLTLFGFIPISINGLVNSQSGLPAAAGTNETKQITNLDLAAEESVYP